MSQKIIFNTHVKRTFSNYQENNVAVFLNERFNYWGMGRFKVGTSPRLDGAAIFWQFDEFWNVCGAKLLLYTLSGTLKERQPLSSLERFSPIFASPSLDGHNCFFLQHLLSTKIQVPNTKPIGIVEDELTAIRQNIRDRSRIWLAAGNVEELAEAGAFRQLFKDFPFKSFELYHRGEKVEAWERIAAKYHRGRSIKTFEHLPPVH